MSRRATPLGAPLASIVLVAALVSVAPPRAAPAADAVGDSARGGIADTTQAVAREPKPSELVDLNHAPPEAIRALPVPPDVAEGILDYRTYIAPFTDIFELLQVKGMTPELLQRLRPLVVTSPLFGTARLEQEEEERRSSELNYLVQRLLSEEGASEGLVDEYVDLIRDPRNLNRLDIYELLTIQNVSPVDAVAVLKERDRSGTIENASELRATPGLSYWGYRNLRDFVRFDDPPSRWKRPSADYQFRIWDTPYMLDEADVMNENIIGDTQGLAPDQKDNFRSVDLNTYAGRLDLNTAQPYQSHKLRVREGQHLRGGVLTLRNLGEERWAETVKWFVSLGDLKPHATRLGPLQLHNLVLGNYSLAFGRGLVMDGTDFFMPRRTGYGYAVRPSVLRGDLSRSEEYALRGAALEWSIGRLRATSFTSRDHKDAILNPDGSFNSYLRMVPRLSNDLLSGIRSDIATGVFQGRGDTSAFLPMRDVMDERVYGTNLRIELTRGASVGMTGMEIHTYNRVFDTPIADRWNPQPTTLVIDPARLEDRDAEIGAGYDSRALGSYRRIWGSDGQAVWRNLAVAAEYAKLDTARSGAAWLPLLSAGPDAWLGQAYLQFENLNLMLLYRDYDLGYDNPYDRAFSEDTRFEQTILDGNAFRLKNPYWAQLAIFVPQPKAERGWYLNARYQISRQLTLSALEFDRWTRKADGADLTRGVVRFEYRPTFPVRFRLRQAISSRHANKPDDIRAYTAWDTRLEMLANLSRFDQLRLLYSSSNVRFAARGRLSGPASGGDVQGDTTAQRGIPGHALQGVLLHNFNSFLTVSVSTEIYDGFLYNYEDNEFVVVDGTGLRSWLLLQSRLSDRLSWRFKWTSDHSLARTYVDIRNYGNLVPPTPDATDARGDVSSFRLQLDWSI